MACECTEAAPSDGGRAQVRGSCRALLPRRRRAAQPLHVAPLHRELAAALTSRQHGGVDRPPCTESVSDAGRPDLREDDGGMSVILPEFWGVACC